MRKVLIPLIHDIKFQYRHGFYLAYLFATVVYVLFLRFLPLDIRSFLLPLIVFTDPAILGYFLLSGIFFLERDQNILENLFVTPYSIRKYILNKVISLGIISYLSSVFIVIFSIGVQVNWFMYTLGVVLTSTFFTLLGFILVVRTRNLNLYIMYSGAFQLGFFLPVFSYLNVYSHNLFSIIPTTSSVHLIVSSLLDKRVGTHTFIATMYLIVWCCLAYFAAHKSIQYYVVSRIGGGNK